MSLSVICDVDGCLVPGRGEMWDFTSLAEIAGSNAMGTVNLTLCSGRPLAFMEALARQLMVTRHCICENGAILFHPLTKAYMVHPAVPLEYLNEKPDIIQCIKRLIADTDIVIEAGKEVMISVNAPDKSLLSHLYAVLGSELKGAPVDVMNSGRSIEVVPKGVSKEAGLAFWGEVEEIDVEQVTAIGDADNDLTVLRAAGFSAAPSNCTENVRRLVDYVSDKSMAAGVADILRWLGVHRGESQPLSGSEDTTK